MKIDEMIKINKCVQRLRQTFFIKKGLLLLLVLIAGCGVYGVLRGQAVSLDFMNYHLYNAYSFITGRFGLDVIPAGIHTFLNPLTDVPLYVMVRYFSSFPRLVAFVQAAYSGVLLFVFYKFCLLFFSKKQLYWVWFSVVLAAGGYMFFTQIGSMNNDVLVNILAGTAVYLLFYFLFVRGSSSACLLFAGFVAGAVSGLKYTAVPVAAALFAVLCFNIRHINRPWRMLGLVTISVLAGFLITNGYFMLHLWKEFGNPVFPFYNQFFKSPYFASESLRDVRFYPHSGAEWLFWPFFRLWEHPDIISELKYDFRLAAGYTSFFLLLLGRFFIPLKKCILGRSCLEKRKLDSLLLLFFVIYIVWLPVFGILRYLIILEMLSCLLLAYFLQLLPLKKIAAVGVSACLLVFFCCTTGHKDWGSKYIPFSDKVVTFNPAFPQVEKNSLVIFWGSPMSFLAPFFPQDAVFIGGIQFPRYLRHSFVVRSPAKYLNFLPNLYFRHRFYTKIQEKISRHTGAIYIVAYPWELMLDPETLALYGLEQTSEPCSYFNSNANVYVFVNSGWALCKVKKAGSS
ncbi:hypothetical protein [Candidatus Avelusimicrobium alvi]|uniref:hypothetical protein n=1 Tax=Candidatus Avelusimicrobium alvi TaxID=3416221 RepID=UPI003D13EEB1